jgi:4-methyl-5(b-hydroxyethyl)-thiazole monophosphate biosynthesis
MPTMPNACVLLAPGFEEIEAITVIDVLRRAAIDTRMVGTVASRVEGSHGIAVEADLTLEQAATQSWDLVVLPGGLPGSTNLRDDERVQALVRAQHDRGGRIAAICAAPIALSAAGVLTDRQATSYPAFANQIACAGYREDPVVVDGPVVTSRGVGTALRFALALVRELSGVERARSLASAMLVDGWED